MQKYYKSLNWSSYDLPRMLEERGVHDADKLPGFHYRDDALRLWQIIKEYVTDILKAYYHSDNDIKKVRLKLTLFSDLYTRHSTPVLYILAHTWTLEVVYLSNYCKIFLRC